MCLLVQYAKLVCFRRNAVRCTMAVHGVRAQCPSLSEPPFVPFYLPLCLTFFYQSLTVITQPGSQATTQASPKPPVSIDSQCCFECLRSN